MIVLTVFRPHTPEQLIPLGAALLATAVLADRLTGLELGSFKLALASPGPVLADRDASFKSFFQAENRRLRRFAVLMAADERTGSDLAKEALASTRAHWGEIKPNEQVSYAFSELLKGVEGVGFLGALAGRHRGRHATAVRSTDADGADWLRAARVLQSLPPVVRAAILLAHLERMPESQIAAILGRPARAVTADLQEGLAQLGPQVGAMVGSLT
jgi:DNA-directed RNA polymerase specialized sigma24 family protein